MEATMQSTLEAGTSPAIDDGARPVSKVLILEHDPACLDELKRFCDAHSLVGLRAQADTVLAALKTNVDLGAVFIAEEHEAAATPGMALAHAIHHLRPELPIFLRQREKKVLSERDRGAVRAAYTREAIDELAPVIDESIFSLVYPNALVRGITEISVAALQALFRDKVVQCDTPHIVRDRIIYGEVFTLIPLESSWCRGYMMLQTEEDAMRAALGLSDDDPSAAYRELNNTLGEATNLIWGAFKNRYISYNDGGAHLTQIPIVINHRHKYISFGSQDPQLCFRYTLTDPARPDAPPTQVRQRFIFNLAWSPDDFQENKTSVEDLFESGELEMF